MEKEKKDVKKKAIDKENKISKKVDKEIKKANRVKYKTSEQEEFISLMIMVVVVLVVVCGTYLFTRAFITKDLFKEDPEEEIVEGKINYDNTIMGEILNRPYDEYYVAIYDSTDSEHFEDMYYLVDNYNKLTKHLHIYTVDLSNPLNASYYDPENVNTKVKSLEGLKVGDITLIKVKKGEIKKFIVDFKKMQKELGVK